MTRSWPLPVLIFAVLWLGCVGAAASRPNFTIANDSFIQDGTPVRLVNACMHYARVRFGGRCLSRCCLSPPQLMSGIGDRPELWADRIARLKALGINGIQVCIVKRREVNPLTL